MSWRTTPGSSTQCARPNIKNENLNTLLDRLEFASGDLIFLHTSYSRLHAFVDSPAALINTLLARLGPNGTLVMPRYAWHLDSSARPWQGYSEYLARRPLMDLRNTPANIGVVPETFRQMEGVVSSISHFWPVSAKGQLAEQLVQGQETLDHAYCAESCFGRLLDWNAKILGLGVTLNTTSIAPVSDFRLEHNIFTPPIPGGVIDMRGRLHYTKVATMRPEAVRQIRPGRLLMEKATHFPFVSENGAYFFSYLANIYHTAAVEEWQKIKQSPGMPVPWMDV